MSHYRSILRKVIASADILLEVVDARFPDETRNSEVEAQIGYAKKPFIIVLNKCDLVSQETNEKNKSRLSGIAPTVFVSARKKQGTTMLRHKILELTHIKGRDILVGSLGYPNTGKSSVINGVSGKHKTSTSKVSGHTKGLKLLKGGSGIMFIDTPGVIPFDEHDECMQGILGVKDTTHLRDPVSVAAKIIEIMLVENQGALESFYDIAIEGEDPFEVLELIGRRCNFLRKKGKVDETRAAVKVANDWQKGLLLI